MPTIIMDSCSYTKLGLSGYLTSHGVKKRDISTSTNIDCLNEKCIKLRPNVVFLNEDCFIHEANATERIKQVISLHPDTLFFIFMAITNVHFDDYLFVRKNVIISSKSIKQETMNQLLSRYLEKKTTYIEKSSLDQTPVTLSQTESNMLRMWMSGQGTTQISDQMQIKVKTVSSHKGNIKRKIKTHNKQVIYHVVRLTDTLTNGIFVNNR
ncbi:capsule biosynthesis protein CapA [Chania multitudinisentens RB-25]|uniref:Transcriptional regulatory protein RcsA n=1 Tax=Chania multitudinisentens RB-25 TaxID=1441930 RepID=W0LI43_9GAMM|nr:transcriptional regulator RcsA [Chania multitudinisentens]AHG22017.1 capsule biosynthesis protein CapA [Chania multitudinisentens RB-25]